LYDFYTLITFYVSSLLLGSFLKYISPLNLFELLFLFWPGCFRTGDLCLFPFVQKFVNREARKTKIRTRKVWIEEEFVLFNLSN